MRGVSASGVVLKVWSVPQAVPTAVQTHASKKATYLRVFRLQFVRMVRFPRVRVGKPTVVRGQQCFPQPQPVGRHTAFGILAFCRSEVGRRCAIEGLFMRQGRKFCAPFTALFVAGSG